MTHLGLLSMFLPLEWLGQSSSQPSSTLLEIQAVCPPDERSWILGEEIVGGMVKALTVKIGC